MRFDASEDTIHHFSTSVVEFWAMFINKLVVIFKII